MTSNRKTLPHDITRSTGVVATWTLLSRIFGMLRDCLIAWFFGAAAQTDAFFVAFKIPNLLRRIVAEGGFATAFVPVFKHELHQSENQARVLLQQVFYVLFALSLIICCIGILCADQLITVFAPGFNKDQAILAAELTRMMMPYVLVIAIISLFSAALNALGFFALPAMAPLILNITLIISMISLRSFFSPQLKVLAVAVIIGGLIALILQGVRLIQLHFSPCACKPKLTGTPALFNFFRLLTPGLISASTFQIAVFINTFLASTLEEGSVSWLYYADRLFQFPLGIFAVAIGTTILPSLAGYAARDDSESFDYQFNAALKWITIITLPAVAGLITLDEVIMSAIFGRGQFSSYDIQQSAAALSAFSVGLWPLSCHVVTSRAYLAKMNSKIPAYSAVVSIVTGIIAAFMFMGAVRSPQNTMIISLISSIQGVFGLFNFGHTGIALSASITALFSFIIQVFCLKQINVKLDIIPITKIFLAALVSSFLMASLLFVIKHYFNNALLCLLVLLPIGGLMYIALSSILIPSEFKQLQAFIKTYYRRN